ncbi:LacI family DNA-binding transcriptional regulator [Deinococcus peraridilitoris]|uniref:Transcriptional regulator n=1 Tax=Deinococcus peraridilitoris (strain DSM 19664 / LMG 22246 / CIP 109416 / KR-200) TaxID=937777 RepID=L0A142_DEIPD|nr:LacI family DNA-binding transcriptional regulator [Deinococcus peraridilitoris]AFZ66907.1 transcriptional regulator [Deinococcus peraridilitoris DSM 19664]
MNISELAEKLNLHASTVSRALNRPESVAEATRQRVIIAAQTYGYRPNGLARSLRTRQTSTLGLIVSDIRNPFYASLAKAIEDVARKNDFSVIISNANEDPRQEENALRLLEEKQVSAIIHCSTGANLEILRAMQERGVLILDLDRASGLDDVDQVLVNNRLGAALAARHLLELGHTRLATIAGPLHLTPGRERLEGFRLALEEAGLALPWELIEVGDFREASGYAATQRLLGLAQPPSALFVANNEMLAGALAALRDQGVRVPRDLSLVSFDDARWAQYTDPPLTVIAQPIDAMGTLAAKLLLRRLRDANAPSHHVLDPHLIIRASTRSLTP